MLYGVMVTQLFLAQSFQVRVLIEQLLYGGLGLISQAVRPRLPSFAFDGRQLPYFAFDGRQLPSFAIVFLQPVPKPRSKFPQSSLKVPPKFHQSSTIVPNKAITI